MARTKKEFNLEIDDTVDEVFDEGPGNAFLAMRTLRWKEDAEFKLDLRKWYTDSEGKEIAGKGFSFITEEGPANLVGCLIKNGYADTRKTLESLQDRKDFVPETMKILAKKGYKSIEVNEEEDPFFDPKDLIK